MVLRRAVNLDYVMVEMYALVNMARSKISKIQVNSEWHSVLQRCVMAAYQCTKQQSIYKI